MQGGVKGKQTIRSVRIPDLIVSAQLQAALQALAVGKYSDQSFWRPSDSCKPQLGILWEEATKMKALVKFSRRCFS